MLAVTPTRVRLSTTPSRAAAWHVELSGTFPNRNLVTCGVLRQVTSAIPVRSAATYTTPAATRRGFNRVSGLRFSCPCFSVAALDGNYTF